ncbi:MAG: SPASM domain-containing protein [Alphaproteobacteria bacterium]|nr:SPASM domain-containing protein [Alphaproteobacteria bacterium]
MADRPFPRVLRIEPASQCNLACTHCPTGTVAVPRGLMDAAVFDAVLDEVRRHRDAIKVIVMYHGGEPLLHRRFFDQVQRIRAVHPDARIKTVTNGMALAPAVRAKVIASDLDEIEISLDGLSPAESAHVRANSETSRIVANLLALIDDSARAGRGPRVSLATVQFIRRGDDLVRTLAQGATAPRWITDLFGDAVTYKATFAMRWPHMRVAPEQFDLVQAEGEDLSACDHVENTITVRANGVVVPCCYDLTSQMPMGNVRTSRLIDIWNGEAYRALRAAIAAKRYPHPCGDCNTVRPHVYLVPKWSLTDIDAPTGAGARGDDASPLQPFSLDEATIASNSALLASK